VFSTRGQYFIEAPGRTLELCAFEDPMFMERRSVELDSVIESDIAKIGRRLELHQKEHGRPSEMRICELGRSQELRFSESRRTPEGASLKLREMMKFHVTEIYAIQSAPVEHQMLKYRAREIQTCVRPVLSGTFFSDPQMTFQYSLCYCSNSLFSHSFVITVLRNGIRLLEVGTQLIKDGLPQLWMMFAESLQTVKTAYPDRRLLGTELFDRSNARIGDPSL
jgi:hypothetical protein